MSLILSSDAAYFGATAASAITAVAEVTAANYTARVQADGGVIVNPTQLTNLFTFLAAQGISPRNWIWGPYFGVRHCNGLVDKIYALNGNDLIRNQPGAILAEKWSLDTTSASYPFFAINTTASGYSADMMQAQALQYLMRPGHTSYVVAGSGVNMVSGDGQWLITFDAYVPGALCVSAFNIAGAFNDSAINQMRVTVPNGLYDPTSALNRTVVEDAGVYADWAGVAAFMDVAAGKVTTYTNNVVVTNAASVTNGLWDSSSTLMQFVMGGSVDSGSTTRYNKQKVAEVWHVSGGTTAQAQAISNRLHTLYF